jgi:two-component SAPR family response regulator/LysM repeat protein
MASLRPPTPRKPSARLGATIELLLVLVGVPVALVATLGRRAVFRVPHLPTLGALQQFWLAPAEQRVFALAHVALWVGLALWAYCVLAFVLSVIGQIAYRLRLGGPSSAVLRMRNWVVPASVRLILDSVFVAALVVPNTRASASVAAMPARPVAAQVVPPAGAPQGGAGVHGRRARLLANTSQAPAGTYTVRPGDTLSRIAEADSGSASAWPTLAQANPEISNPDLIHPGEVLDLPSAWPTRGGPAGSAPRTYVVQEGECLWSIAARVLGPAASDHEIGALSTNIFQANRNRVVGPFGERMERPRSIEAGWTLIIPAVSSIGPAPTSQVAPVPAAPDPVDPSVIPPDPAAPPAAGDGSASRLPSMATPTPSHSPVTATPAKEASRVEPVAGIGEAPTPDVSPSTATGSPHPLSPAPRGPQVPTHTPPDKGRGVHVPGGFYIPVAAAAGLLALWLRARAQRLRRWSSRDLGPEPLPGPVTQALFRAETVPALDLVGPLTHRLVEIWRAHNGRVPRILAAWEQGDSVRFLLSGEGSTPADSADDETGVQVRFLPTVTSTRDRGTEALEGTERSGQAPLVADVQAIWAVATGPRLPRTRRGIFAFVDGLLVPIAERPPRQEGAAESIDTGWLHLPLLGEPLGISGSDTEPVAEALVVAAALRPREGELRLVAVGDVLKGMEIPDGIDLPPVERLTSRKRSAALRHQLEEQLVARRESFDAKGIKTFAEWAALVPDDRFDAWILVLDAEKATEWSDLLEQGSDLGIAALVLGGDAPCVSRRLVAEGGALRAAIPGFGDLADLTPFVLPEGALQEVADIARGPAEEDEPLADAPVLSSEAPPAEAVRLFVLGGLRVEAAGPDDEAATRPKRAKSRELIAYLAYMAVHDRDDDGWVSKGNLCNVLWPRADASYLDVCVADARKWLEGPRRPGATTSLIQQADGKYRLDRQRVWIDLAAFEAKVQEARASADPEQTLREALALYRGDLLDSQEQGERERFSWVQDLGFRINVRKRYHWALAQLSDVLQATGRPAEALELLEPALRRSLCEELECKAMTCEGELQPRGLGDRQAVMQRWERLCSRLEKDLGADPVPSTCEVYDQVLRQTERSSSAAPRAPSHRYGGAGAGVRLVTPFIDEPRPRRNGFGGR